MLRAVGATVDDTTPDVWRVAPGRSRGGDLVIEPDLSNAAAVPRGGAGHRRAYDDPGLAVLDDPGGGRPA